MPWGDTRNGQALLRGPRHHRTVPWRDLFQTRPVRALLAVDVKAVPVGVPANWHLQQLGDKLSRQVGIPRPYHRLHDETIAADARPLAAELSLALALGAEQPCPSWRVMDAVLSLSRPPADDLQAVRVEIRLIESTR